MAFFCHGDPDSRAGVETAIEQLELLNHQLAEIAANQLPMNAVCAAIAAASEQPSMNHWSSSISSMLQSNGRAEASRRPKKYCWSAPAYAKSAAGISRDAGCRPVNASNS